MLNRNVRRDCLGARMLLLGGIPTAGAVLTFFGEAGS